MLFQMAQFQCGVIAPRKGRSEMKSLLVFVERALSMIAIGCVFVGIFVVGIDKASAARGWFEKSCAADPTVCTKNSNGDCTPATSTPPGSLGVACDVGNGAGCSCGNATIQGVHTCVCE